MVVWKPVSVQPYTNSYEVSNEGQVRNTKTNNIKSPLPGSTGYASVRLDLGKSKKTIAIHQLVAQTFLGPQEKGMVVNHKDENKDNNHLANLEYATRSQNRRHSSRSWKARPFDRTPISQVIGKSVDGYPGYLVTENGRIYNLGRNRFMNLESVRQDGYKRVTLQNPNKIRKKFYVHQLVAKIYIPNPEGHKYVNHISCVRDDNNVSNLEWVSASENMKHNAQTKDVGRFVLQLTKDGKRIALHSTAKDAARDSGANYTAILHVCAGRKQLAGGYKWRYLDKSAHKKQEEARRDVEFNSWLDSEMRTMLI
jgi:hypothetical protein